MRVRFLEMTFVLCGIVACSSSSGGGGGGEDASTPGDSGGGGNDSGGGGTDAGEDAAMPTDSGGGGTDSGKLPFGAACQNSSDCDSNLCFNFNAKGMHCTTPCQTAADCPGGAGGLGCSGMGVCKTQ